MTQKPKAAPTEPVQSIKGFGIDWKCRDFQFEIGKTYTHAGKVEACKSGFHACEYPLDVFGHYAPGQSRYAEVVQSGKISRHENDTKIASASITITAEIGIPEIVKRAVAWVLAQAKPSDIQHAEGDRSAASSTGNQSAASSTGDRSAASSTGDQSAAMSAGRYGRAMGADGCALFLVYRDDNWDITHAWAGIVGRDGIKPLVWYSLDAHGKPQEVTP